MTQKHIQRLAIEFESHESNGTLRKSGPRERAVLPLVRQVGANQLPPSSFVTPIWSRRAFEMGEQGADK